MSKVTLCRSGRLFEPKVARKAARYGALLFTSILLVACKSDDNVPGDQANDRLSITNSAFVLNSRVTSTSTPVVIENDTGYVPPGVTTKPNAARSVSLTLISEVAPPIVEGELVQATSISLDGGNKAMVSYNMAGAPRLGAIDYLSKLKETNPILESSVAFNDADINAVSSDGKYVYAAVASASTAFPYPAVLERILIKKDKFVLEDAARIALTSFAATSVVRAGDEIYATSGDAGSVFAFDKSDLAPLGEFALHDARWVAWDKDNDRIVVVQGTPGQISIFEEGEFPGGAMQLLNTFPFPGADVPESKSTADVAGGKAFIAAGPDGVQIVCLDDGQIVGSVPVPDAASLGLDPGDVVTNAVSIDKDLMFISNGGAGIYVAQGADDFKDTDCTEQQQITVLGKLRFEDFQSVNHVEYKDDRLVIAAGRSGVKVVSVSID